MKHAKLCLAVGILLLTASGVLVGKRSASALQSNSVYHYAYVSSPTGDALDTLYLVDPRQPDTDPRAVPLPIPEGQSFVTAEASPTGEWLYLLSTSADSTLLQLFKPTTTETRNVFEHNQRLYLEDNAPNYIPVWAPDGQSLAFIASDRNWDALSVYHYVLSTETLSVVYQGRRNGEGGEILEDVHDLAWRPDSAALALYERDCIDLGVRECVYRFAVVSVPDGTLSAESAVEFDSPALYQLSWSPDGQYLGFHYQTGDSVGWFGAEFYEAMVWQPATDTITQLTHFTNPLPVGSMFDIYLNRYYMHWLRANALLVGYDTEGYSYDLDQQVPDSVHLQTDILSIPDASSTILLSEFIEEWVSNPATDEVAFMSTLRVPDERGIPQFQDRTVQLGSFDGQALSNLIQLPEGHNLSWSPDGLYLVYRSVKNNPDNTVSDGLLFVNQLDRTTQFVPIASLAVGWVRLL
jgi:hypothetical protein